MSEQQIIDAIAALPSDIDRARVLAAAWAGINPTRVVLLQFWAHLPHLTRQEIAYRFEDWNADPGLLCSD
jgi:hypothetical protein